MLTGIVLYIFFTDDDMKIKDVLRFFKGDGPAIAFETGHQKGGHFLCSSSEIRADRIFDFAHSVYSKHLTLEYMQSIKLSGGVSKENTLKKQIAPWHNLSKQDLQEELFSCNIKVATTKPEKDLEILVINKMRGYKRVPAILYDQPLNSLRNLTMQNMKFVSLNQCMILQTTLSIY